ncbi:MAG TPA: tetratricopeptide repeat protein [Allosphingosinicella sp.]|nr:tetratricopeptide repeat protein [Allosphingosinicella sp.]
MANRKMMVAALVAACAVPASASVVAIGSTNARLCFEAADSPATPSLTAVHDCDEALLRDGLPGYETVATHVNRGILHLRRNNVDLAISDFDAAIALDPEQPESYLNKGAALMRRQDSAGAVQLFTVALERNTSRPAIAHYGRAVAQEAMGNINAAYQDFRRAQELAPNWREPGLELARFRVVEAQ